MSELKMIKALRRLIEKLRGAELYSHHLTFLRHPSTIGLMRSLGRALLAMFVLVSFSGAAWAACIDGIATPGQQMACCKDGEFKCAPHGSAQDCCQTDAARSNAVVAGAKIEPVHAPIAVLVAWAALPNRGTAPDAYARFYEPASPPHIDPGPPPYIAFSSLLI